MNSACLPKQLNLSVYDHHSTIKHFFFTLLEKLISSQMNEKQMNVREDLSEDKVRWSFKYRKVQAKK